jgi:hypothetical protein
MTDTPDIAHRFDKFTMPCDIPDGDGAAGGDRSADGLRSPPSRGLPQDYGVPTQDWLSRGLKSKAGRGWEAEAPYGDPDPDDDPYYGLSYDYGQDPRSAAHDPADPAAKAPYDHYPSSAALLQARRAARMGGSGYGNARKSAAPQWPGGWLPGDPPREIVLDSDPWADPCSGSGDPTPANSKFGAAQQVRFLDGLALHGNVRAAAARVGVSRDTVYRLRRREPAFAQLWEAALVHARAAGEAELASRAFDGVAVPVFCRGEHVATWRRHDPRYLLTHLARLDRRIAQNGGAGGVAEQEAQARAECFDTLLAGRAGQSVPEHHARAAQLGARLAAEDCEPAWPETGTAAGEAPAAPTAPPAPVCADLPPSRLGVFGLACEEALEAQEAAVAAGRKDYRDAAARHRADDRAVERATAKALARFEQWQAEGRELLDRVLAGAGEGEAGEGVGDCGGRGEGGVPQGDASAAGSVSDSSGLTNEPASELTKPGARRDPVSQVSAAARLLSLRFPSGRHSLQHDRDIHAETEGGGGRIQPDRGEHRQQQQQAEPAPADEGQGEQGDDPRCGRDVAHQPERREFGRRGQFGIFHVREGQRRLLRERQADHSQHHEFAVREIIVVEIGPGLGMFGPQQAGDDVIAADEQQHAQHRGEVERELVLDLVDVEPEGREHREEHQDQQREQEADPLRVLGGGWSLSGAPGTWRRARSLSIAAYPPSASAIASPSSSVNPSNRKSKPAIPRVLPRAIYRGKRGPRQAGEWCGVVKGG